MRVSSVSTYLTTTQSLASALERVQKEQAQVGSGKVLTRWSDDAAAASAAERYRSQEADWASYQRTATDAKGWLGTADGALQSMSSVLARAKELAVSAANGSLTAASRRAIAEEVDQLRTEMRDLGNTTHLGRSLFGGFGAGALATDGAGTISWAGDDGSVRRQVSPTITLQVNVSGREVFGFGAPAGEDVFAQLTALSDAVRTNDGAALATVQGTLQTRHDDILKGLGQVGTTTNRVETAYAAGGIAIQDLASRRSELEDVDLADAVLKMSAAQAGYTAALGAASRANLPSLADFLR